MQSTIKLVLNSIDCYVHVLAQLRHSSCTHLVGLRSWVHLSLIPRACLAREKTGLVSSSVSYLSSHTATAPLTHPGRKGRKKRRRATLVSVDPSEGNFRPITPRPVCCPYGPCGEPDTHNTMGESCLVWSSSNHRGLTATVLCTKCYKFSPGGCTSTSNLTQLSTNLSVSAHVCLFEAGFEPYKGEPRPQLGAGLNSCPDGHITCFEHR